MRSRDGAQIEIFDHGAHVSSWQPAPGDERLFLSSASEYREGAAIRGGIPVIFPQFAARGPLPKHGFARTAAWSWVDDRSGTDASGAAVATLRLTDSPQTRAIWPHAFAAELRARSAEGTLEVTLSIANTGDSSFFFTAALHTYLRVDDVRRTRLRGLRGTRYEDSTAAGKLGVEREDDIEVTGELDRVYLDVRQPIDVMEEGRTTRLEARGFSDAVVWNPGPTRGAALADLEPDGWRRMLCVEAAVAGKAIALAPGERWAGTQILRAE